MTEPAASRPWGRLPGDLAVALRHRLEETVDAVARNVSASSPAFASIEDPKFERDVHSGVRVAVERFLDLVGTDQPALPPAVRETFVALGAAEARDERSPDVLLAALRASSRRLLRGNAAEATVLAAAADIGWRRLGSVVPVLLPVEHARDARFRYGAEGVVLDREHDAILLVREGRRAGRDQLTEALRGRSAVVGPTLAWSRVPEAVRLAELTAK